MMFGVRNQQDSEYTRLHVYINQAKKDCFSVSYKYHAFHTYVF